MMTVQDARSGNAGWAAAWGFLAGAFFVFAFLSGVKSLAGWYHGTR